MWINTQLNRQESQEQAFVGKVSAVDGNCINVIAHTQAIGVSVAAPYGVASMPTVGDEVVLIPTIDEKYLCIGGLVQAANPNEITIKSPSGAAIILGDNGTISLNGLVITKEGILIGN